MDGIEIFNSGKPVTLTPEQQPPATSGYNRLVSYVAYHTTPVGLAWPLTVAPSPERETATPR